MIFPSLLGIIVATLIAIAFGYMMAVSILPLPFRRRFAWILAPGIGFGLCSLLFFVFRRPVFTVEIVLLLMLSIVWYRRRPWTNLAKWTGVPLHFSILAVLFAGALGFAVTGLLLTVDRMPYGDWDGWNIWNSHARLLNRAGSNWQTILPYTFHGDYPLLTSAVAARYWRYAGTEIPEVGALLGILLTLSGVGVLALALMELRDKVLAVLFALVLLGTPYYLELGSDQFADVPLSFFILTTIALIVIHLEKRPANPGLLALAGFTAGCAAWTKNEGLLFLLVASAVLLAALFFRGNLVRPFAAFLLGASVPVIVIVFFKLTVAPRNDLIAASNYRTLLEVMNPERHVSILRYAGKLVRSFGAWTVSPIPPLFGFVALRGSDRRVLSSSSWLTALSILAIMTAGYYSVYAITPHDLQYHLDSSLDRLMTQLWPSFLLVLGLAARPL
jgi:hypothetical protein